MASRRFALAALLRASGLSLAAVTVVKILHISQTINKGFGLMF